MKVTNFFTSWIGYTQICHHNLAYMLIQLMWCHFEVSSFFFFQKTSSFPKESPYWHTFFCIFSSIQCGKQLWSNFCNKGARKTNFGDDPTSWFTTSRPWQFVDCLTCKYIYILTLYCGLKSEKSSNSKQLHHLFKKGLKWTLFEIFFLLRDTKKIQNLRS